ncbi:hypothetical protein LTS00_017612 [Friedmanniomyces endolithicus]|uniref:Aminoglycoside phosphotransferase domain-containing protein n=1 Tax=Friedmanniomyces endolithicus TaxID=329885 RepID=A0AAN6IZN3_9PEZI|nr:hypothetical protein LTS00_017612 [Friedmanniomyces endolithicus]KAK0303432.1 hypothetical protein LTR82_017555 [Friedmanniomyces endolithicus]
MAESDVTEAFHYTSGRWLYNESKRLSERSVRFNIPALLEAAARSVGRTTADVRSFKKLAEGGFNRIFELAMRDGTKVIARLPYPIAQPGRLAVASEVATMDLIRSNGVPVPKVFDYSADATNPVGTEYIFMEKVPGKPLGDAWFTMSEKERMKVLSAIVDCEAKIFAIDLPASGSIFYEKDLLQSMDREPLSSTESTSRALCVGPDVSLKFWFEDRSALEIQRRPYTTPADVLLGAAVKEMAWLRTYGRPRMPFERMYRDITEFRKSDPQEHLQSLENYTQVASHLVPNAKWLCKPTIRHPDLNPNNIFVSDNYDVVGIIDWQHCKALPLFLHAGIPHHFQNYGDFDSEGLVKPQLPADFDQMDENEQKEEAERYRRRQVHFYYMGATAKKNEVHFDALMHEGGLFRRRIFEHAAEPWEGNSIPLKADLIRLARHWSELVSSRDPESEPPPSCPFTFKEKEVEKVLQAALKQEEVDGQIEILRNVIGAGSDGWIPNDKYNEAMAEASQLKAHAIESADDDFERETITKYWPFDDFDEKE